MVYLVAGKSIDFFIISLYSIFHVVHLSAEEEKKEKNPRIFGADAERWREKSAPKKEKEREAQTFGLTLSHTMLRRRHRMPRELFSSVFRKGFTFRSPSLALKVLEGTPERRFSVVTEKKSAKGAVARNRLRRQGYHALGKRFGEMRKRAAGIFFIKKEVPFTMLEKEMDDLLARAGFLK